jgi:DNA-binding LytR/AlgR family response regulator
MIIRSIIVDDEPLSLDILEGFIADIPMLELVGRCHNAIEAIEILQEKQIDLMFLDINMPKLTGTAFVKSSDNLPLFIFTTAYPEYAVEGFELDAVDYLVKPFSFERFLKAVQKAADLINMRSGNNSIHETGDGFLSIKSDKKFYRIDFKDLDYLQSYGDFVKVFSGGKMLITNETLKNLAKKLPRDFIRIHKGFVVNLGKVKYIEGNQVFLENQILPVGLTYREELITIFKKSEA